MFNVCDEVLVELIILGDHRFVDDVVEHVVSGSSKYVIVTSTVLARVIGRVLYEKMGRSGDYEVYVFKDNYPEEYALKIMVYNRPDIVIDCDPSNTMPYLKKLVNVMYVNKVSCGEIVDR